MLGTPLDIAAEVVSYTPDETPPPEYRRLVERDIRGLETGPRTLTETHFIHACIAMAAMRTLEPMSLRRRCWS